LRLAAVHPADGLIVGRPNDGDLSRFHTYGRCPVDVQLLIAERGSWKVNQPRFFRPHPTLLGEIARLETRRTNDDRAVGGYIVDVRLGGAWGGVGDRLDAVLGRPVRRERPLVFSNHVSGDDRAIGRSRLRIEA